MHFSCRCGYVFHDNTDFESFKAAYLANEDMEELADIIQAGDNAPPPPEHDMSDTYLMASELMMREIFQCPECGRIFIEDPDDTRRFFCFSPDTAGEVNKGLLKSAHRDTGYITADWWDEFIFPQKYSGIIQVSYAIRKGGTPGMLYFDKRSELEERYHEMVQEYSDKGQLRWSSLRINGKEIHSYKKRD